MVKENQDVLYVVDLKFANIENKNQNVKSVVVLRSANTCG